MKFNEPELNNNRHLFYFFTFIVDTNDEWWVIGIIEQSLGQGSIFYFLDFVQGPPYRPAG